MTRFSRTRLLSVPSSRPLTPSPARDFSETYNCPTILNTMIASTSYQQTESRSGSSPLEAPPLPSAPSPSGRPEEAPRRRSSFSFLHRSKSGERLPNTRSSSRGKLMKRHRGGERDQEFVREQIPQQPPKIPDLPSPIHLQPFASEDQMRDSAPYLSNKSQGYHQNTSMSRDSKTNIGSNTYNVPIPPIPDSQWNGAHVDPYAKAESMTHRGRYSYASSAVSTINSPRRVRRRRDPTPFK